MACDPVDDAAHGCDCVHKLPCSSMLLGLLPVMWCFIPCGTGTSMLLQRMYVACTLTNSKIRTDVCTGPLLALWQVFW
jgi:hypothetical protein